MGSNFSWFDKHPPMSAFFLEFSFKYLVQRLGILFIKPNFYISCFYFVFKLATEILEDIKLV